MKTGMSLFWWMCVRMGAGLAGLDLEASRWEQA